MSTRAFPLPDGGCGVCRPRAARGHPLPPSVPRMQEPRLTRDSPRPGAQREPRGRRLPAVGAGQTEPRALRAHAPLRGVQAHETRGGARVRCVLWHLGRQPLKNMKC